MTPRHPPAFRRWSLLLVAAGLSALLAARTLLGRVVGESMLPSYAPGDVVWLMPSLGGHIERGDVVLVRAPRSPEEAIKRVVAVGGDRVEYTHGRFTLNGVEESETWLAFAALGGRRGRVVEAALPGGPTRRLVRDLGDFEPGAYRGPLTVPDGQVYVLGDNRDASTDSRLYGPLPSSSIVARVGGILRRASSSVRDPERWWRKPLDDPRRKGTEEGEVIEVEDRLGASPLAHQTVVYLRPTSGAAPEDARLAGFFNLGAIMMYALDPAGNLWRDGPTVSGLASVGGVFAHEYAHTWFAGVLRPDGDTRWLFEAVPELVAWEVADTSVVRQNRAYEATETLIKGTWCKKAVALELPTSRRTRKLYYGVGPYTLLQLEWLAIANGGTHTQFWQAWQGLIASHSVGDTLSSAELSAFLDGSFSYPGAFYDEWVSADRVGTPVLALTDVARSSSGAYSYTVGQIQEAMFEEEGGPDWSSFTQVPYVLSCSPSSALGTRAFDECGLSADGTTGSVAIRVAGASSTAGLTSLVTNPRPLTIGVLSAWHTDVDGWGPVVHLEGGALRDVPARVPSAGDHAQKVCLGVPTGCGIDADGDGFRAGEDCDDADSAVHPWPPGAESPSDGMGQDYNCDGLRFASLSSLQCSEYP